MINLFKKQQVRISEWYEDLRKFFPKSNYQRMIEVRSKLENHIML